MDLEGAMKFHGHLCPMFYLGLRMGELALRELERRREEGVKLVSQVEFRNCLADGIQYATGATYGKNNLTYLEHGKFAASFHDMVTDKKLRLRVRNDVLMDTLAYGLRGQKVKSMPMKERQKEAIQLFKWGSKIVEDLKKKSDEAIFEVEAGKALRPEVEASLKLVTCSECNEAVLEEFTSSGKCKRCETR